MLLLVLLLLLLLLLFFPASALPPATFPVDVSSFPASAPAPVATFLLLPTACSQACHPCPCWLLPRGHGNYSALTWRLIGEGVSREEEVTVKTQLVTVKGEKQKKDLISWMALSQCQRPDEKLGF